MRWVISAELEIIKMNWVENKMMQITLKLTNIEKYSYPITNPN